MPEISEEELAAYKAQAEAVASLESSKLRVESEHAKLKKRAQEAEERLSAAEKAKLEAEGNTVELLEKERTERLSLQEKYNQRTNDVLREKLRTEVSRHAKDAHDIDMLLKVGEHKDILKLDSDSLSVDGVKDYVEKVRETHGYLFSKKRLDNGDKTPPKGDEAFKTEEDKYLSDLRACTTRQQIEEVRKRHGKSLN